MMKSAGPAVRRLAFYLSLGLLTGAILSLGSWFLTGAGSLRPPHTFEFVIPGGTAALVQAGEEPQSIPSNLTFLAGDTLVLRNEDSAPHQMGPYPVLAGSTLRVPLPRATFQTFVCTFHPQSAIGLEVRERSSPLWLVWGTLLFGLPLGAGVAAVNWIIRAVASEGGMSGEE